MTSRTRVWVLAVSIPIIIFALVGGYLGQVMAKDDTYQHLRVFDDVVAHVVNNYVEEVDIKQAMRGAMRGLADALDADSAYLTPDLVKAYESNNNPGPADIGVEPPASHGHGVRIRAIEVETRANADMPERTRSGSLLQRREWRVGNRFRVDPRNHRPGLHPARERAHDGLRILAERLLFGRLPVPPPEVEHHRGLERQYGLIDERLVAIGRRRRIAVPIEPERLQL